ncbi:MAG: PsiF family protein, partial [Rhodanobacteraceae bacterium]
MELKVQFSLSLALAFAVLSTAAFAQDSGKSGKTLTPQQQRMVECNKEATGKTGDERKTFMSSCLKGETAATPAKSAQQEKMTGCNAEAK